MSCLLFQPEDDFCRSLGSILIYYLVCEGLKNSSDGTVSILVQSYYLPTLSFLYLTDP